MKILPLNMSREARLSFHLSSILRPKMKNWFYERYVNLYTLGEDTCLMGFVDDQIDFSYRCLYEERKVFNVHELIKADTFTKKLIEELITDGHYCYIWVDKFYIKGTEEYQAYHFVHPIMLYGYDNEKNEFYALNFFFEKGSYTQKISYCDLIDGICNLSTDTHGCSIDTLNETLTAFKPINNMPINTYNIEYFTHELHNYLFSRCDNNQKYLDHREAVYGISCYDKMISIVKNGGRITFKALYDFEYHKECLLTRLNYICEKYTLSERFTNAVIGFEKVYHIINQTRLLNMKYNIRSKIPAATFSIDPCFIKKFLNNMKQAYTLELDYLIPIYKELRNRDYIEKRIINASKIEEDSYIETLTDNAKIFVFSEPKFISSIVLSSKTTESNKDLIKLTLNNEQTYLIQMSAHYCADIKQTTAIVSTYINEFKIEYVDNQFSPNMDICMYGSYDSWSWNLSNINAFENLKINNDITDVIMDNNILFAINGFDPQLIYYNLYLNASKAPYVYIKMRSSCLAEIAQLLFTTLDDVNFNTPKSKSITISPNNEMIEYIFDMSDNEHWQGIISALRFDPTGYDNITFGNDGISIEYIHICDRLPVYNHAEQYYRYQGVNGWYYYYTDGGKGYHEMTCDSNGIWSHPRISDVAVQKQVMISSCRMGAVIQWVCQASGTYSVKFEFQLITNGDYLDYSIYHNHREIQRYVFNKSTHKNKNNCELFTFQSELLLQYGDVLDFEMFNNIPSSIEKGLYSVRIDKIKLEMS